MKTRSITLFLACALASTISTASAADKAPKPTITLRVVNYARVPRSVLRDARAEAMTILTWSDIDLIWLTCDLGAKDWDVGRPCSTALKPNEFWLDITDRRPPGASQDLLGFTDFQTGMEHGQAGVYYPAAVTLSDRSKADAYQILAAAIVHEIGHLILGAKSHSTYGVMIAGFGEDQLEMISHRWLRFTSDQNKLIQSEVRKRASELAYAVR